MKAGCFVIIAAFVVASPSVAQVDCSAFDAAINMSLKQISSERASGITDNSAPRETMRAARVANYLQVISMNLALMKENKCPARQRPIVLGEFMKNALECELATIKGEKDPPACNFDNWKREEEKPKEKAVENKQ
ncbi:MAG: hypothetical protein ABUT39_09270 [Acidobacteriota bacterium]